MAKLAIHLNDTGIRAAQPESAQLIAVEGRNCVSPGYALHNGKQLTAGSVPN